MPRNSTFLAELGPGGLSSLTLAFASGLVALGVPVGLRLRQVVRASADDERRPGDAILVLGRELVDDRPTPVYRARLEHGAALWRDGVAPRLLVSGGWTGTATRSEAAAGREYLLAAGVPDAAIETEERSRHTLENLHFVRESLRARGLGRHLPGLCVASGRHGAGHQSRRRHPDPDGRLSRPAATQGRQEGGGAEHGRKESDQRYAGVPAQPCAIARARRGVRGKGGTRGRDLDRRGGLQAGRRRNPRDGHRRPSAAGGRTARECRGQGAAARHARRRHHACRAGLARPVSRDHRQSERRLHSLPDRRLWNPVRILQSGKLLSRHDRRHRAHSCAGLAFAPAG
ncbi:MAG: hypothetical protein F9K38_15360 [Pseudorhodoplanes sp.]|nr:MAG: hypothetical protein F9K38_15360 [Pseudorhodoplanes sp.]